MRITDGSRLNYRIESIGFEWDTKTASLNQIEVVWIIYNEAHPESQYTMFTVVVPGIKCPTTQDGIDEAKRVLQEAMGRLATVEAEAQP